MNLTELPVEIILTIIAYSEQSISQLVLCCKHINMFISVYKNKIADIIIHDYKIFDSDKSIKQKITFKDYKILKEHYYCLFDKTERDLAQSLKKSTDPSVYEDQVIHAIANDNFTIYLLIESAFPKLKFHVDDNIMRNMIYASIEFNNYRFFRYLTNYAMENNMAYVLNDTEILFLAGEFASLDIFKYIIESSLFPFEVNSYGYLVISIITRYDRLELLKYITEYIGYDDMHYSGIIEDALHYYSSEILMHCIEYIQENNIEIFAVAEDFVGYLLFIINKIDHSPDIEIQLSTIIICKMRTNKLLYTAFDTVAKFLMTKYNYGLISNDNQLLRNALMAENAVEFVDYLLKDNDVRILGGSDVEFAKFMETANKEFAKGVLY
ncbi:MAG: hypothetical protein ACRCZI_04685 [Cetobacterium sp.]